MISTLLLKVIFNLLLYTNYPFKITSTAIEPMENSLILKTYQINQKLGAGSFGEIFQAQNIKTKDTFAIKIQKRKPQKQSRLFQQVKLYKLFSQAQGFCNLREYGSQKDFNFMIIDKLSYSLEELFQLCGKKFTEYTVMRIAEQLISRIQYLHEKGYVHRDIKSTNFMIGSGKNLNIIYLIDFGLAKPYKDFTTGSHIKRKGGKSLVGTARYASIASHQGFQQCRRDDLQSLGYLFIYLINGSLPWQGIKSKIKQQKYAEIGNRKKSIHPEQLCAKLAEQFYYYFKYVRALDFANCPDYKYLRGLFLEKLKKKYGEKSDYFDWEYKLKQKTTSMETSENAIEEQLW